MPKDSPARRGSRSRSPPARRSSRSRSPPARRRSRSPRRSRSRSPPRRRSRSPAKGPGEGEDVEKIQLEGDAVAYLLGRDGSTKRRLERVCDCRIEISHDEVEVIGTDKQRALGMLCINITLQQRKGRMNTDFGAIEKRGDCEFMDVPCQAVGFVLGHRGATLRLWEERYGVYMVFDNENKRDNTKRIYVLGRKEESRAKGLAAVKEAVEFRMKKDAEGGGRDRGGGGGGGGGGSRGGGGGGYRRRSPPRRRRSYSRSRSRSPPRDRRRSYRSRSRSRGRR